MTEDDFWICIAYVDKQALGAEDTQSAKEPLVNYLAQFDVTEVESFSEHLANALYELDTLAHAEEAGESDTDDSFLYARCYVVGMGRAHYQRVLASPCKMPKDLSWFEDLLYAASDAWSRLSGRDKSDWNYATQKSYETGSNRYAWGSKPFRIALIRFETTTELTKEMQTVERKENVRLSLNQTNVATAFASQLRALEFETPSYEEIFLRLTPLANHGEIRYLEESERDDKVVGFEAGLKPQKYSRMDGHERFVFFIDLLSDSLKWLADRDGLDRAKIEQVQASLLATGKQN